MARQVTDRRVRGLRGVVERVDVKTGERICLYAAVKYRGKSVRVRVPGNKDGSVPAPQRAEALYYSLRQEIERADARGETWIPPLARAAAATENAGRTFGDLCDEYIKRKHPDAKGNSHVFFRDRLKQARAFFGDDSPITQLTRDRCARYAAEQRRYVSEGVIAASTARHNIRALQSVFNAAVDWEWIQQSPARKLPTPKVPESTPRFLFQEEWAALTEAADDLAPRWKFGPLYLRLAVYTLLRPATLLSLTWADVDMISRRITVQGADTKTRRAVVVPVCEPLHAALTAFRSSPKTNRVLHHLERPLAKYGLRSWWDAMRERSGLGDIKLYDLKDTGASWMLQAGISLDMVAEIIGHSATEVTHRYAAFALKDKRAAMDVLAQFEPPRGTPS